MAAVVGVPFTFTLTTNPVAPGQTATLVALYGTSGDDIGLDADSVDLVFPVSMDEGVPGVYSTEIIFVETGVYWAEVSIGSVSVRSIIRVTETDTSYDASVGAEYVLAVSTPAGVPEVQAIVTDRSGSDIGVDDQGDPITWPQVMEAVPGRDGAWFFGGLVFTEPLVAQVSVNVAADRIYSGTIKVSATQAESTLTQFSGWKPDGPLVPDEWVPLSFLRRWTGWTQEEVSSEALRELRRLAINTFIDYTRTWIPGWTGTWYGIPGQGDRVNLPCPIVMPSAGGIEPEVMITDSYGNEEVYDTISNDDIEWRVSGPHVKTPYIGLGWALTGKLNRVRIRATFGWSVKTHDAHLKMRQVILGLVRWHSLSYGASTDESRGQATFYRTTQESSRDMSQSFDKSAISSGGLTGDPTIDRALLEFRMYQDPWVYQPPLCKTE